MPDDVWAARDTTPAATEAALRELLAARHRTSASFVPARVINLVAIVDGAFRGEIENRLERVGRYHPSRLIICAVDARRKSGGIDAVATLSSDVEDPAPGVIAVLRERVEIEIGPQHLRGLDTIVDPLLVPELATVVWAPHRHLGGVDALRHLAQVVLLDSQDEAEVAEALQRACDLAGNVYVVDLAWLRSTPWRERVAAAFDPPDLRRALGSISSVAVRHRADSASAGLLFCGWLSARLGWRPSPLGGVGADLVGRARARRGEVSLRLTPVAMSSPGLAGVTIQTASGESISLDRASGGLALVRSSRDGSTRAWTVLGASRGESGILGEGVRQALLRDPVYRPALEAARAMAA
jgi:glucose-6-phosphate dehydrogenase assembly protein OpcA